MPLDADLKTEIYRHMYRAMRFEMQLLQMLDDGLLAGGYHAGRGQEGSEVAAVLPLRRDDYLLYDHRGTAHMIAKGMDLVPMYGDFLGNDLGTTGGLGAGIVHISDPEIGVLGQSGTLGGGNLIATGAALSAKLRGTDQVVLNIFGDGAANRGTFHEAANVAGAWKLPVVFYVQNNRWAVSVPADAVTGGGLAERGPGYGMPGERVDGMNPFEVYDVVGEAIDRARRGDGPSLIEADVIRLRGHYEGDPGGYRDDRELEEGRERDPIPFVRRHLLDEGVLDEDELEAVEADIDHEVERAAEKAMGGQRPGPERLDEKVYA